MKGKDKCKYIGCENAAVKEVEYETSPGEKIKVKVCPDHQNEISDVIKKAD